jgi:hypothetical protein
MLVIYPAESLSKQTWNSQLQMFRFQQFRGHKLQVKSLKSLQLFLNSGENLQRM